MYHSITLLDRLLEGINFLSLIKKKGTGSVDFVIYLHARLWFVVTFQFFVL